MDLAHIKWEHVPATSATNSYDLLEEVIAAIEAEPKRIYMPSYISRWVHHVGDTLPACGTQGCIAGWAAILHFRGKGGDGSITTGLAAQSLMPRDVWDDWTKLTVGGPDDPRYPWPSDSLYYMDRGAYARIVVGNIRRFMGRHAEVLKAHNLADSSFV